MTATNPRNGRRAKAQIAATGNAVRKSTAAARAAAADLAEEISDTVDEAGSVLQRTARSAVDTAASIGHDVGARVADTAANLRDQAGARAAGARDALTEQGDKLAESLRRAAAYSRTPAVPAQVLTTAADGVSHAVDTLRGSTLDDMTRSIRGAAQRNPGLFAAGAALAGFALARFLMSSRSATDSEAGRR